MVLMSFAIGKADGVLLSGINLAIPRYRGHMSELRIS